MSGPFSGTFEWSIKPPLLTKMLSAKNGEEFESKSFKLNDFLEFALIAYPNGHTPPTENSFIFGLTLDPWPTDIESIVICRCQFCKETKSSATCINTYSAKNNSFGWLSRRLLLSELKQMGSSLQCLHIGASINILKITRKPKHDDLHFYPSPLSNVTYFAYPQQQRFEWRIDAELMKLFKLSYYGKRYESRLTTGSAAHQWMMACYPNGYKSVHEGSVCVFIRVCMLPPTMAALHAKFKIECVQTKDEWYGRHAFKFDDASVGNVKFMRFSKVQQFKTLTFRAHVQVIESLNDADEQDEGWCNDVDYETDIAEHKQISPHHQHGTESKVMQQQLVQQVYSAQFKQYRFELDLLRRQNMQLMERLNSLERKVNVLQMSPIEEETHHQRTQCVLFEEEKSNEHMHGSDEHKNETEGIQQLTSQLLLYREKFSSLQQQSRMAAADTANTPCTNQPATTTADGQEQHQQDEQPEDELSEKQRELLQWLEERELDEYFCVFGKHGFDDLASLKFLTMNELNEIGIEKLGHRMKILHSIEKLKSKYLPLYHMGYDSVIEYDSKDLNLAYEKSHEI